MLSNFIIPAWLAQKNNISGDEKENKIMFKGELIGKTPKSYAIKYNENQLYIPFSQCEMSENTTEHTQNTQSKIEATEKIGRKEIIIPKWLAEKNEINEKVEGSNISFIGEVIAETEKGYLINYYGKRLGMAKSQCKIYDTENKILTLTTELYCHYCCVNSKIIGYDFKEDVVLLKNLEEIDHWEDNKCIWKKIDGDGLDIKYGMLGLIGSTNVNGMMVKGQNGGYTSDKKKVLDVVKSALKEGFPIKAFDTFDSDIKEIFR